MREAEKEMWGRKATAELNKIKPEVMCDLDHREEESQVEELVLRGTQLKQWARLRAHTLAKVDIHVQNRHFLKIISQQLDDKTAKPKKSNMV